jgi:arsenate reductase-like glutaredoxin family protein
MGCKKAQGFLEEHAWQVIDHADATKARCSRKDALELAKAANEVVVAKGKKVVTFDMRSDTPDNATLLKHLLGPTGNLRAPTLRVGKTLLVGFNEEAYEQVLQKRQSHQDDA